MSQYELLTYRPTNPEITFLCNPVFYWAWKKFYLWVFTTRATFNDPDEPISKLFLHVAILIPALGFNIDDATQSAKWLITGRWKRFDFRRGQQFSFSPTPRYRQRLGLTKLQIKRESGDDSPEVRWTEREADHSCLLCMSQIYCWTSLYSGTKIINTMCKTYIWNKQVTLWRGEESSSFVSGTFTVWTLQCGRLPASVSCFPSVPPGTYQDIII
jgi:hypothetical protein